MRPIRGKKRPIRALQDRTHLTKKDHDATAGGTEGKISVRRKGKRLRGSSRKEGEGGRAVEARRGQGLTRSKKVKGQGDREIFKFLFYGQHKRKEKPAGRKKGDKKKATVSGKP